MEKLSAEQTAKEIAFAQTDQELKSAVETLQPGESIKYSREDWNKKFENANPIRYCNKHFVKNGINVRVHKVFGNVVIERIGHTPVPATQEEKA